MRSIAEVRLQEGQPGALLAVVRDADARRADDLRRKADDFVDLENSSTHCKMK